MTTPCLYLGQVSDYDAFSSFWKHIAKTVLPTVIYLHHYDYYYKISYQQTVIKNTWVYLMEREGKNNGLTEVVSVNF